MSTRDPAREAADRRYMRLALAIGRRHLGQAWPNPSVGAVLVGGPPGSERILAQGVTQPGGRPHAERVALAAAGEAARGATLYVTLEPCSHHGRTSPCADATIAAGIARVVSAMDDPDPRVAGRGHARLAEAGIAVSVGLMGAEAARDQRGHVSRIVKGRPALFLKLARTADGYAAGGEGRLMISGPRANAEIHLQGPIATRSWSASARCWRTIPSSPCACPGWRRARRCGSSSTRPCARRQVRDWCAPARPFRP